MTTDDVTAAPAFDPITGLPGQGQLLARLARAGKRARREAGYRFALLVLDLDGFGRVDRELGRPEADRVLAELACRLSAAVRGGDLMARLEGDEFAVLLEGLRDQDEPATVVARLQRALGRAAGAGKRELVFTASVGIVPGWPDCHDPAELIAEARAAARRAREHGRGGCELAAMDAYARSAALLQLEAGLHHSVRSRLR